MTPFRYSAWDGTQQIEWFTPEEALDHIAGEMLEGGDLRSIMNRLMRQGANFRDGRCMPGMRELLDRARQRREQALMQHNLDGVFDDIQRQLEEIIEAERRTVEQRLHDAGAPQGQPPEGAPDGQQPSAQGQGVEGAQDSSGARGAQASRVSAGQPSGGGSRGGDAGSDGANDDQFRDMLRNIAQQRRDQLEALPPDAGGRIQQLRDYDFMDPEARERFDELLKQLQQQMLQNYFEGMQQSLQSLTQDDLKRTQQMVHDLNAMLRQRLNGQEPDFDRFMQQYGDAFPDGIQDLDQLMDYLQDQVQQMQSLMRSMAPDQRAQLESLMEGLLRDNRLQIDLMEMAGLMQQLRPGAQGNEFPFIGDDPLSLQDALRVMGELNDVEALERALDRAMRMNDVEAIDPDEIARILGEDAGHIAEQLRQMLKMLEDAGILRKRGNEWELTPRAVRKVGERALRDIFGDIESSTTGDHTLSQRGAGVERMDETRPYMWGDSFGLVDTHRTVLNAVTRGGPQKPVRLSVDDFEVNPTQALTSCATVIMLDMSYSMMHGGRFQAGRKIALALDTLIRAKFPKDELHVVAFSYLVATLKPQMLLDDYWIEYGGGTNYQQALRQARQILRKYHVGTRQIVFITDGEPTTYSQWSGVDPAPDRSMGYRRLPGALQETLREVVRCTKDDITINTFVLDSHPHMGDFLRTMAKINKGRVFFGSASELGQYILLDYVNNKKTLIK